MIDLPMVDLRGRVLVGRERVKFTDADPYGHLSSGGVELRAARHRRGRNGSHGSSTGNDQVRDRRCENRQDIAESGAAAELGGVESVATIADVGRVSRHDHRSAGAVARAIDRGRGLTHHGRYARQGCSG
jgi:hypothetical protein